MGRSVNAFKRGSITNAVLRAQKRGQISISAIARSEKASRRTVSVIVAALQKGESVLEARRRDMDKARRASSEAKKKLIARRKQVVALATKVKTQAGRKTPAFPSTSLIASELGKTEQRVHRSTVFRDLRIQKLHVYVRPVHPFNEKESADKRFKFACKKMLMQKATADVWKKLTFVDETFVDTNDRTSKTQWIRQGYHQLLIPRVVKNRFNVPHFQLFAAIGYNYKSGIVFIEGKKDDDGKVERLNASRYIRWCLSKIRDRLKQPGHMLVQDGARCHIAKEVVKYMENQDIEALPGWPSYSPDLNPIENCWKILAAEIAKDVAGVVNVEELKEVVVRAWDRIPMSIINNLVLSFRDRLAKVRMTRGARVVSSVKLDKMSKKA